MEKISSFGIFTILFVSSLTIMVGSVIAPAIAGIVTHTEFSFSPSWLITLPSLGVVLFGSLVGKLLNRLGIIKLLVLELVPYAVLGFIGAFISNDYLLILDRILLGAATVAIQVAITAYIANFFTGEARIKMIAWQGMAIELGGVVFLTLEELSLARKHHSLCFRKLILNLIYNNYPYLLVYKVFKLYVCVNIFY